ncbi:MAG: GNAT family N-acetyltransferase [Myxococcota bacterium]
MIAIRRYTPADDAALLPLLVAAFRNDPGYEHVFREGRDEALTFLMPRLLALRVKVGTVRVAEHDGEVAGVLSSTASNVRLGMVDYVMQGLPRIAWEIGLRTTRRLLDTDREILQLRNTVQPTVHHRYLAQLACHPDHQGQGVGRALMESFLAEEVDPVHQHAALMTTKSTNVLWYGKAGFEIAGQSGIQGAFTAWCMVRPPR